MMMKNENNIEILTATTQEQLDDVRDLINEFLKWHLQIHLEDMDLINEYFDPKDFKDELGTLPGKYAVPEGKLLLALCNNEPAGCVALKKLDDSSCEMKRMFVYPKYHGKGIGYRLAVAIIEDAKHIGYKFMKLDTSFRQTEAQKLYEGFGFKKIEPYYDLPDKLKNWLVFMELEL